MDRVLDNIPGRDSEVSGRNEVEGEEQRGHSEEAEQALQPDGLQRGNLEREKLRKISKMSKVD